MRRSSEDKARSLPVGVLPTGVNNYFARWHRTRKDENLCDLWVRAFSRLMLASRQLMRTTLSIVRSAAVHRVDVMELMTKDSAKPSYAMVGPTVLPTRMLVIDFILCIDLRMQRHAFTSQSVVGWGAPSGLVRNKTRFTHLFAWDLSLFRTWFSVSYCDVM